MQFGNLTPSQRAIFNLGQESFIRNPTFVLWIEGFGDTTKYVMSIEAETGLESLKGSLNIGRAILELNNEKGHFYSNGTSMVKPYSRIKIWAGFKGFNVPIFTGMIYDVKPNGTQNLVVMNCRDYMGFFFDAIGKFDLSLCNTPKTIIEYFCSKFGFLSEIADNEETNTTYSDINIMDQGTINALGDICNSIFHIAYFDEDGILRLTEREHSSPVDWEFNDNNITDYTLLADTEIINEVTVEYRNGFFSRQLDQPSINEYKTKSRHIRIPSLGSDYVSENMQGTSERQLDYDLEGFKFTSAEDSSIIDTIHIRMKGLEAHGYISAKIYTDNDGIPENLLGVSSLKASGDLRNEFSWEIFYFSAPIRISPLTDYWCIFDTNSVDSGALYLQINNTQSTGNHTYYNNSSWHNVDDSCILHIVKGNNYAFRLANDLVRFCRKPNERLRIVAPAIPHLQLLDEVKVNINKMKMAGRYAIERRRHLLTVEKYTTMDTLRKVG